jgi:hypothetical protein
MELLFAAGIRLVDFCLFEKRRVVLLTGKLGMSTGRSQVVMVNRVNLTNDAELSVPLR